MFPVPEHAWRYVETRSGFENGPRRARDRVPAIATTIFTRRAAVPLFLAVTAWLAPGGAWALDPSQQPFLHRRWPQPTAVNAAAQGPDGLIWLGSRSGLRRFDGERFVDVDLAGSGGVPWVRRVLITRAGVVWLATGSAELQPGRWTAEPQLSAQHAGDGGLLRLAPHEPPTARGRLRRFTTSDGLPNPWVWALFEDAAGAVWIGTEAGLARFDGARFHRYTTADGLPSNFVTSLAPGPNGALLVGTSAGVVIHGAGGFAPTPIREPVVSIAADRAGRLWAATGDRVLKLDLDLRLERFPSRSPVALAVDLDDNVWVSNAADVFVGGRPVPLTGKVPGFVTSLLVDREGSLWQTVREGEIFQLRIPRVRNIGTEQGLAGEVVFSLIRGNDGSIVVATNQGLSRLMNGTWTPWASGGAPRSMALDPQGGSATGLWIGTETTLVHEGRTGRRTVRRLPDWPEPRMSGFFSIVPTRKGGLWVAQWWRGLLHFADGDAAGEPRELLPEAGLCGDKLTSGIEASDGSIWFGVEYGYNHHGVTRVQNGRARCYREAAGLAAVEIGAVTEDRDGTLWLGTGWGRGLVRFRDERFVTISAAAGLPSASITGLLDDGRGYLWIGSEAGVWRVPKADLNRCAEGPCPRVRALVYGSAEGMLGPECTAAFHPNMLLDDQGSVWVATLKGVSVFPPPERAQRAVVRPVIEEISIDGVPRALTGPLHIAPGQRDLVVRYTATSFLDAARPLLRHRLHGFDADWVVAGTPAVSHYKDLPAAQYTLEMRAGDEASARALLTVVAEPPFWRTRSFLAALVVAACGIALALHRLRVATLELRHRVLAEERLRISRDLHDGVSQKLRAIGLLSDRMQSRSPGGEENVRLRNIVHETDAELRRAIWDLHEATDEQRLETLVERLLSQLVIPEHIKVTLQTTGSSVPVRGLVAREAHQVIREALSNAIRHGQPDNIEIGVLSDDEGLHVWVRDDGRGLTWNPSVGSGGGYGMLSMHERARRVGGTLTTNARPGGGTDVSLFVPAKERRPR
jgi:signal transduction histidine kinase/ligand-binding sensor domain-containing protein